MALCMACVCDSGSSSSPLSILYNIIYPMPHLYIFFVLRTPLIDIAIHAIVLRQATGLKQGTVLQQGTMVL